MLNDRRRHILEALVEEYVSTAEPVSSRALVDRYNLGVSTATVRNELSLLEEAGFLVSPHVSSGRIPTDSGYRAFVDNLMERARVEEQADAGKPEDDGHAASGDDEIPAPSPTSRLSCALRDELMASAAELDDLLARTSRALTRFTDCLSIVLEPRVSRLSLKKITLVQMEPHHVLMVVVSDEGRVLNRTIETAQEYTVEEVSAIEVLLNKAFVDHEQSIETEFARAEVARNASLRVFADELSDCLDEADGARIHNTGISSLYAQPELQNARMAMTFAQLVDDDIVTLQLFGDLISGKGVVTRIGRENPGEAFDQISVVASRYGDDEDAGIIAVVGPTRMHYRRAIEAVRTASIVLDETLKGQQ